MSNKAKAVLNIIVWDNDNMQISIFDRGWLDSALATSDWQEARRALEKIMPAHLRLAESSVAQCSG